MEHEALCEVMDILVLAGLDEIEAIRLVSELLHEEAAAVTAIRKELSDCKEKLN